MSNKIKEILEIIESSESNQDYNKLFQESKLEKIVIVFILGALILTITTLFFESLRMFTILFGVIFLMSITVHLIVQSVSIYALFRYPMKYYAQGLKNRLDIKEYYIKQFHDFDPVDLSRAIEILQNDCHTINERLSFLIGAIKKIGIIPAGLALYYAAFKHFGTTENSDLSMYLMGFVFGMYAGALMLQRVLNKIELQISCLREAEKISIYRKDLTKV